MPYYGAIALVLALTPIWLWGDAPAWWAQREVIKPGAVVDDYAAVNQGQVRNIAKQAYEELNQKLVGGAGPTLYNLWHAPVASQDDFRTVNLGQLKYLADPFYARLAEVGYTGQPLKLGQTRPWAGTADDYAMANIGQVKELFSFAPGDMVGPATPANLVVNTVTQDGFVLSWTAATDNVGVVDYRIYLDGVLIGSTTTLSYGIVNLAASMDYSMTVKARDAAGNESLAGVSLSVSTPGYLINDQISTGKDHSLALKKNGTIWAWGKNNYGQLGQGNQGELWYPTKVESLSGMAAISAGGDHSLALKSDGTVWAWGNNYYGQLGDGTVEQRLAPIMVPGLSGVVAISTGEGFSLALKSDGTVWAWGANYYNQLGDGATDTRRSPVQITGLSGVVAIDAGFYFGVALKADGTVWAWGQNNYGQLGSNYTPASASTPVRSGTIVNVSAIAAGDYHVLALKADGGVVAWGRGYEGQLGDNNITHSRGVAGPVTIPAGSYIAIAAGQNSSAALKSDGTLYVWGNNSYGQVGNGATANVVGLPYAVPSLFANIVAMSAGQHAVAINSLGQLYSWGYNQHGQLGQGSGANQASPALVQSFTFASQLGLPVFAPDGGRYLATPTVVVTSGDPGAVLRYTLDGTEPTESSASIVSGASVLPGRGLLKVKAFKSGRVSSPTKVAAYLIDDQVSTGKDHTLALKKDGTVWAWGKNNYGQLGQGNQGELWYPAKVESLSGVKAIAAGGDHSLALKSDGTVWAWGTNYYGQLGDGTAEQRLAPIMISGLSGVVSISAGEGFSLALKSDGTVWAWGTNYYNQLGDGTTDTRRSPVQIAGLSGIVAIDAGFYFGVALKRDGSVWAWGLNNYGQLGSNYTPASASVPIRSGTIANVIAIAAGDNHVLALKADGALAAWGRGYEGQLGDNNITHSHGVAGPVTIPAGVYIAIAAGQNNSAALKLDGTLYTWGNNSYGQIGNEGSASAVGLPYAIPSPFNNVTAMSAGQHAFAINSSGQFYSWGYNEYGQLGQSVAGNQTSPALIQSFSFANQLTLPVLAPDGGRYLAAPAVTITSADSGVVLRYTLDGTEPTGSSTAIASGASVVPGRGLLKVKSFKSGYPQSETKAAAYLIGDQIATGGNYALALRRDGTVWAWGANDNGQLGLGNTVSRNSPVQVTALGAIKAISAGSSHSLAVDAGGGVWAWGYNGYGQLGTGGNANKILPSPVQGLTGVQAVSAGETHSLALKSDGTIWAWGSNYYGELGNATDDDQVTPQQVSGLTGIIAVAAGPNYSLALKSDGVLWAWGGNYAGQLGTNYSPSSTNVPVRVGTINRVIAIAAGSSHVLALNSNGAVFSWGSGYSGQLGGPGYSRGVAGAVTLTGQYMAISAGLYNSAALRLDGVPFTWGDNYYGQIGNGATGSSVNLPVVISGLSTITDIATGQYTVTVGMHGGIVGYHAMGENNYGQLGDGTVVDRLLPVYVAFDSDGDGLSDLDELALGTDYLNPDTDGDDMSDGNEVLFGLDPLDPSDGGNNADPDNDLMPNKWEVDHGLNPNDPADAAAHADTDGLTNLQEYQLGTDPNQNDTDSDGWSDSYENANGYDPLSATDGPSGDPDGDGLTNADEIVLGTNPNVADTDGDGLKDGDEIAIAISPLRADTDGDGLTDGQEVNIYHTDPAFGDSDSDGLPDKWEIDNGLNPLANDASENRDTDDLSNLDEYLNGTNPSSEDSDGDGVSDSSEIDQGSNPNNVTDGGLAPPDENKVSVTFHLVNSGKAHVNQCGQCHVSKLTLDSGPIIETTQEVTASARSKDRVLELILGTKYEVTFGDRTFQEGSSTANFSNPPNPRYEATITAPEGAPVYIDDPEQMLGTDKAMDGAAGKKATVYVVDIKTNAVDRMLGGYVDLAVFGDIKNEIGIKFVHKTTGEVYGIYDIGDAEGGTYVYKNKAAVLSDEQMDQYDSGSLDAKAYEQDVVFVRDEENANKIKFYTTFTAVGAVDIILTRNGQEIIKREQVLVADAEFGETIAHFDARIDQPEINLPEESPDLAPDDFNFDPSYTDGGDVLGLLSIYRPGTMAYPGLRVSEADEANPLKLLLSINNDNDEQGPAGQADNRDDAIDASDDDVSMLVVRLPKGVLPGGDGTYSIAVNNAAAIRILNNTGTETVAATELSVNLAAPDGPLSALATTGSVTLWIEGLSEFGDIGLTATFTPVDDVATTDAVHLQTVGPTTAQYYFVFKADELVADAYDAQRVRFSSGAKDEIVRTPVYSSIGGARVVQRNLSTTASIDIYEYALRGGRLASNYAKGFVDGAWDGAKSDYESLVGIPGTVRDQIRDFWDNPIKAAKAIYEPMLILVKMTAEQRDELLGKIVSNFLNEAERNVAWQSEIGDEALKHYVAGYVSGLATEKIIAISIGAGVVTKFTQGFKYVLSLSRAGQAVLGAVNAVQKFPGASIRFISRYAKDKLHIRELQMGIGLRLASISFGNKSAAELIQETLDGLDSLRINHEIISREIRAGFIAPGKFSTYGFLAYKRLGHVIYVLKDVGVDEETTLGFVKLSRALVKPDVGDVPFWGNKYNDVMACFGGGGTPDSKGVIKESLKKYNASSQLAVVPPLYIKGVEKIFSKGYRYASALPEDIAGAKWLPAREGGYYASFDSFPSANVARRKSQLPNASTARYRIEFDVIDVKDNVQLPRGMHNAGPHFEPIARDYPDLPLPGQGDGGATQIIVDGIDIPVRAVYEDIDGVYVKIWPL